jgi:hypothetical protein
MKRLHDYICWNCKVSGEAYLEFGDFPLCPECGEPMEIWYTKVNFDSYFPGSHNSEYSTHGRKFQGCTKDGLLDKVSYSARVGDKIKYKKALKGQVIDDKKHAKKIK